MQDGKKNVPEEKLKTVQSMLDAHLPPSMVHQWLLLETGINLSEDSMKAIRHSVMIKKFKGKEDNGGERTVAQKLLSKLEELDGVEYCYLTASYDLATDLVTVVKVRNSRKGKSSEELKKIDEEAKAHVKNVIKGLGLGDGQILLAVAWVTAEGKLYHKKYPFLLGQDGTFRTNAEKRALERLIGKTLNNNLLPFVNAFTPSRSKWVYDWLWGEAFPILLDLSALALTSMILYDQDEQNINANESKLDLNEANSEYGQATRRLCKWHKVRTDVHFSWVVGHLSQLLCSTPRITLGLHGVC